MVLNLGAPNINMCERNVLGIFACETTENQHYIVRVNHKITQNPRTAELLKIIKLLLMWTLLIVQ